MAGPHACRSPCRNPLSASKDELAGAPPGVCINDSGTLSHTPAMSRIPTPASAFLFASAELVAKYTNANLQRNTKLDLELFVQGQ